MSKVLKLCGFLSLIVVGSIGFPAPASADLFAPVNQLLNEVNGIVDAVDNTVRHTDGTVQNVEGTLNHLTNVLGVDSNQVELVEVNVENTVESIFAIYEAWYRNLSPSEQEITARLIMEYARNQRLSYESIASEEWFVQQSFQEQQMTSSLFFQLNEIINALEGDTGRFFAFAFCVNSGGQGCLTQGL